MTYSNTSVFHQIARFNPDTVSQPANVISSGTAGTGDKAKKYEIRFCDMQTPSQKAAFSNNLVAFDKSRLLPHNDAHMHPWDYRQKGVDLKTLILRMQAIGCQHSVVMPIPTSLISLQPDENYILAPGYHHCGEPYYVPEKYKNEMTLTPEMMKEAKTLVELGIDSQVDDWTAHEFRGLSKEEQDMIDPMITGLPLASTYADIDLFKKLERNPGVFTGGGEITFYKEMVQELYAGKGQADLDGRAGPSAQLIAAFGVAGMPVTIHCDVDTAYQDKVVKGKPANLDAFEKFLSDAKTQNTKIIWAHAGGLGRFVLEPDGHMKNLQAMLDKHPNLVLDISWSQVAKQLSGKNMQTGLDKSPTEKAATVQRWADFINKNSDRMMFGSDTLAPKSDAQWAETLCMYNEKDGLFSKLTKTALENVTTKSYENHIKSARPHVRAFEKHILPEIKHLLTHPDVSGLDMNALAKFRDEKYAELAGKGIFNDVQKAELQKKIADTIKHQPKKEDYSDIFGSLEVSVEEKEEDKKAWEALQQKIMGGALSSSSKDHIGTSSSAPLDLTSTTLADLKTTKVLSTKSKSSSDEIKVAKGAVAEDVTTTTTPAATEKSTREKMEKAMKKAGYYASWGRKFQKYGPNDKKDDSGGGKGKSTPT